MTQSFFDGISVIVPTWNRADLLNSMLESLHREIESYEGECEVIVVDSSEGEQKDAIVESCTRYGALYCEGDQSVRRKRNLGVDRSRFELLLFLDSDIVVEPGILKAHVEAYNKGGFIGAVQGLTRFVGKGGVFWKTAELSGLVDSFSNAEKYPFQSWSITKNPLLQIKDE